MYAFHIQMERAHQVAKARQAAGDLVEALRITNTLTRALTDDPGASSPHEDVIDVDTLHIDSQNLCQRVVWMESGARISGMPGGGVEFPPRS